MNSIGEKLRELRMALGYSQNFVADSLKIARSTYVKYETGSSKPTRKLKEIAAFYGVSTDYILGVEPERGEKEKAIDETMALYNQLPEQDKEKVKAFIQFMANQNKE